MKTYNIPKNWIELGGFGKIILIAKGDVIIDSNKNIYYVHAYNPSDNEAFKIYFSNADDENVKHVEHVGYYLENGDLEINLF
jgi:hypothetical protein